VDWAWKSDRLSPRSPNPNPLPLPRLYVAMAEWHVYATDARDGDELINGNAEAAACSGGGESPQTTSYNQGLNSMTPWVVCGGGRRRLRTSGLMHIQCACKSPPHEYNVLKKGHPEVTTEKWYKGQNMLSFISSFPYLTAKQEYQMTCNVKKKYFHFLTIENHTGKSLLLPGGESTKTNTHIFSSDFPDNLLKYCTEASNHPVYVWKDYKRMNWRSSLHW
jgi:hypothetical protein